MGKRMSWVLMAVVLALSLGVGVSGHRAARTEADRVTSIASNVRCPTCRSLSAAESDAKAAHAVRDEIQARVRSGQTDAEIRGFLASRYGKDILLKPDATGVAGLVWSIPVALGIVSIAGLIATFRRWKAMSLAQPATDDDRALVDQALRG